MAKDVRAVIVKLCDRLHNMRTLQFVPEHKQIKTAKETLEVYAPLAHRLGMNGLKSELENLCLFYLNPQEFKIVDELIDQKNEYKNFDINGIIAIQTAPDSMSEPCLQNHPDSKHCPHYRGRQ